MLIDGLNYKDLGEVPESILLPIIEECADFNWSPEKYNQPVTSGALAGGKTLEFPFISRHPSTMFRPYSTEETLLLNSAMPLFEYIQEFLGYPVLLVRCEFATLPANTTVRWHIDSNHKFFAHCKRIHIPVTTNADCKQLWKDETTRFEPGRMYEYNNQILHCASNKGNSNRTTLILDLIKESEWETLVEAGIFNKLLKHMGLIRSL